MEPALEALDLKERLNEKLRAAGLETVADVIAEREANGTLEHLAGIGEAYDEDVRLAISEYLAAHTPEPVEEAAVEPEPEPEPEPVEEVAVEPEPEPEPVE